MKYSKLFNNHSNYNDYITGQDKVLPNVSYCRNENEVHYNPIPDPRIIAEFNVTSTETATFLFNNINLLQEVEIDGVVQQNVVGSYQFDTLGIHTVKYRLIEGTTTIDSNSFSGKSNVVSIIIPNILTSIGSFAFNGCTNLISVTIPNSVTTIGNGAFQGCSSLANITIPNSVTTISSSAFQQCSALANITIPDNVTSIGEYAFNWCDGLINVEIGSGVTSIGDGAFQGCSSLETITCLATSAPTIVSATFRFVKNNGTLYVPTGSTGYNVWMGTGDYYLGKYSWTKVEQ